LLAAERLRVCRDLRRAGLGVLLAINCSSSNIATFADPCGAGSATPRASLMFVGTEPMFAMTT